MSVVVLSAALKLSPGGGVGQRRFDMLTQSDSSGAQQARLLGPPRWTLRLVQPDFLTLDEAGLWSALALRLRGRVNVLAAWDPARPAPRGTLRGTLTLAALAAAGDTSVAIAGATHKNLLRHTQEMGGASWGGLASVTANSHTAPDGSATADTITDSSGAALQGCAQGVTVANDSAAYMFSIYVRKTSGAVQPSFLFDCTLGGGTAVGNGVRLNTDTGVVLLGTATVADAGSFWRVMAPLSNNGTGNTYLAMTLFPACAAYGLSALDNTQTGAAVVWGAQIELASAATDYAPGATLLAGDWLQIGTGLGTSQLVMCTAAATADGSGVVAVEFEPPLRQGYASATAVAWDKPLAYYRQQTESTAWTYINNGAMVSGLSLDLMEVWS